jgi:hypothetical protein
LKQSDGHAARNMLKFRQTLMCGNPRVEESSSFDCESRGTETPVVPSAAEETKVGEHTRPQSRIELQRRTADAIDRIANAISDTGLSTTDLMKKHLQVSENQNASMAERIKQKGEMHKVEMRKKQLEELAFLRDNMVIS